MTALAPRRRPIFSRRSASGPSLQLAAIIAGVALIACLSFAAGVSYGSQAQAASGEATLMAAVSD